MRALFGIVIDVANKWAVKSLVVALGVLLVIVVLGVVYATDRRSAETHTEADESIIAAKEVAGSPGSRATAIPVGDMVKTDTTTSGVSVAATPTTAAPTMTPTSTPVRVSRASYTYIAKYDCDQLARWAAGEEHPAGIGKIPVQFHAQEVDGVVEVSRSDDHLVCRATVGPYLDTRERRCTISSQVGVEGQTMTCRDVGDAETVQYEMVMKMGYGAVWSPTSGGGSGASSYELVEKTAAYGQLEVEFIVYKYDFRGGSTEHRSCYGHGRLTETEVLAGYTGNAKQVVLSLVNCQTPHGSPVGSRDTQPITADNWLVRNNSEPTPALVPTVTLPSAPTAIPTPVPTVTPVPIPTPTAAQVCAIRQRPHPDWEKLKASVLSSLQEYDTAWDDPDDLTLPGRACRLGETINLLRTPYKAMIQNRVAKMVDPVPTTDEKGMMGVLWTLAQDDLGFVRDYCACEVAMLDEVESRETDK